MTAHYRTINPATGKQVQSYSEHSDVQLMEGVDRASEAFTSWRLTDFAERSKVLEQAGALLAASAGNYAATIAEEMGKPRAEGEVEILKCADACRYYAVHSEELLASECVPVEDGEAFIRHEPLGILLAIMPWNFPFWQVFRCAVPALMAGNAVILKPAPNTPRCGLEIEKVFAQAGLPSGVFQTLLLSNEQVTAAIGDRRVTGVSFTGSVPAGREIAEQAGANLKRFVLELGGSDPFIVFDDVNVAEVAQVAVSARCYNNGQSCISPKRILVQENIFEEFATVFVEGMKARKCGDPLNPSVDTGPLAREDLRAALASQVDRSVQSGAKLLCGGHVPHGPGFFYPPTVLSHVAAGMSAYDEELFGPVGVLIPFKDENDLLPIANHPQYGLGATLWTADRVRAQKLIPGIEAGNVFVNSILKSDVRLPFGGIKCSGVGRELSQIGIREFTNTKSVWIK